jgi:antitoxin component YwqK of YwqJK toxin-antitoxin module
MSTNHCASDKNVWISRSWYDNGNLSHEGSYVNGVISGPWRWLSTNGKLILTGSYGNGKPQGVWFKYDDRGNVIREIFYTHGVATHVKTY